MKFIKTSLILATVVAVATPALAQNRLQNVGSRNIAPNNIGGVQPAPQPCRYNCYNNGSREQLIGGVVGGIIGGIIAGSANRRNQQVQQTPQPIQQQPIQQQPIQQQQVQAGGGFSQQHYQYCINRFKSYVIQTNTYTSFSGQTRYCNSPYN